MKIVGYTVGTPLPKPNFDQTDPRKGDYIKGDRSFLHIDNTLSQSGSPADAKATGEAINSLQVNIDQVSDSIDTKIESAIADKANSEHNHDISDIDGLQSTLDENLNAAQQYINNAVADKANTSHTHDDRYYPIDEIDSKLDEKADTSAIPTALSELTGDESHRTVTDVEKDTWNAKSDFSGSYNDLTDKPTDLTNKTYVDEQVNDAKTYANTAAQNVKNDLLNGAGAAYDTLKELGDLIDVNVDAIDALEKVAAGKADADHTHDDRYYTESKIDTKLNDKAPTSHASAATTYGAGTGSNYGHVKLSDSTSSTSGASAGIAATPAAVKAVYDYADSLTAADVGAVNPNLLDNWYFVNPINSRPRYSIGDAVAVEDCIFDKWICLNGTLRDNGVEFPASGSRYIITRLSDELRDVLDGQDITISALFDDKLCVYSTKFTKNSSGSYNGVGYQHNSVGVAEIFESGHSGLLKAMKLELGSVQTLAHQNTNGVWVLNEIPNYAEQKMICSQYSDKYGTHFVGTPFSNPNLLDNWYFIDPIDQRNGYIAPAGTQWWISSSLSGTSGTAPAHRKIVEKTDTYCRWVVDGVSYYCKPDAVVRGYLGATFTVDRWLLPLADSVLFIEDSGIRLYDKARTSAQELFRQDLSEEYSNYIRGKTVTLSILMDNQFKSAALTIPQLGTAVDTTEITIGGGFYFDIYGGATGNLCVRMIETASTTERQTGIIQAIKLEIGRKQTLVRQDENGNWVLNDLPPNKDMELLKCCMNTSFPTDSYANNKVTPAVINAVNKAGDTMYGNLTVNANLYAKQITQTSYNSPMEIGKYLDFHNPESPNDDYALRLSTDSTGKLIISSKGEGGQYAVHGGNISKLALALQPTGLTLGETDVLSLAPGRYTIDGVTTQEQVDAMNLPCIAWHWEFNIYASSNISGTTGNYKIIEARNSNNEIWYRHLNWDTWNTWQQVARVSKTVAHDIYTGDMNDLVTDGHYRLQTNANLINDAQYGQAIVSRGNTGYDTVIQMAFGFENKYAGFRSGVKRNDVWAWTDWQQLTTTNTAVLLDGSNAMTGVLAVNSSGKAAVEKVRTAFDKEYKATFGMSIDAEDVYAILAAKDVTNNGSDWGIGVSPITKKPLFYEFVGGIFNTKDILCADKTAAGTLRLSTDGNGETALMGYNNSLYLQARKDEVNRRQITMRNPAYTSDDKNALLLQVLTNGNVTSEHTILHTGNKNLITAADVGAAPAYTYGTSDMTAGSSSLATGQLYFVYE